MGAFDPLEPFLGTAASGHAWSDPLEEWSDVDQAAWTWGYEEFDVYDAGETDAVSGFGAQAAVPWAEVDSLDARVRQLSSDAKNQPATTGEWAAWSVDWGALLVAWSVWTEQAAQNVPPLAPKGVYGDEHVAEFDRFKGRFNELRRRFLELGGKTSVAASERSVDWPALIARYGKWVVGGAVLLVGVHLLASGATTLALFRRAAA